ncbi:MAG: hypothetical protein J6Y52_00220 [Bacteroidales bacterium]|nr:hypothetical protein [Bacteroidales bacterium]
MMETLMPKNQWYCIKPPVLSFLGVMENIVLIAVFAVVVVGEVILIRHEYGSKKFWKHTAIWYAVYVVLIVGMTIGEGINFNVLGDPLIIPLTIAICLYPVIALLELMLVISIARWVKNLMLKITNSHV